MFGKNRHHGGRKHHGGGGFLGLVRDINRIVNGPSHHTHHTTYHHTTKTKTVHSSYKPTYYSKKNKEEETKKEDQKKEDEKEEQNKEDTKVEDNKVEDQKITQTVVTKNDPPKVASQNEIKEPPKSNDLKNSTSNPLSKSTAPSGKVHNYPGKIPLFGFDVKPKLKPQDKDSSISSGDLNSNNTYSGGNSIYGYSNTPNSYAPPQVQPQVPLPISSQTQAPIQSYQPQNSQNIYPPQNQVQPPQNYNQFPPQNQVQNDYPPQNQIQNDFPSQEQVQNDYPSQNLVQSQPPPVNYDYAYNQTQINPQSPPQGGIQSAPQNIFPQPVYPQQNEMFSQNQENQHNSQNVLDKLSQMYPTNMYQPSAQNNYMNNIPYQNPNSNPNPYYKQNSIYDSFNNNNNSIQSQSQPKTIYSDLKIKGPHPNSIYASFEKLNINDNSNQQQNIKVDNQFDLPSENEVNKNGGQPVNYYPGF